MISGIRAKSTNLLFRQELSISGASRSADIQQLALESGDVVLFESEVEVQDFVFGCNTDLDKTGGSVVATLMGDHSSGLRLDEWFGTRHVQERSQEARGP